MIRLLYILGIFCMASVATAQHITIYGGLSIQRMSDLKMVQQLSKSIWPVETRSFGNFGPYWQQGLIINFPVNNRLQVGLHIFSTSTGSRIAYEDYSGRIQEDFNVRCHGWMANVEWKGWKVKKLDVSLYTSIGLIPTTVDYDLLFRVGNDLVIESENLRALNKALESGATGALKLSDRISLQARIGFHLNYSGKLRTDNNYYLATDWSGQKEASSDWTGLKVSTGIRYYLKSQEE